jgi:hypothetical protein
MKERYFVGTLSNTNPEIEAMYWFEKKADAIIEVQRRRSFYFRETHVLCKVLNVPSLNVASNGQKETEVKE